MYLFMCVNLSLVNQSVFCTDKVGHFISMNDGLVHKTM